MISKNHLSGDLFFADLPELEPKSPLAWLAFLNDFIIYDRRVSSTAKIITILLF